MPTYNYASFLPQSIGSVLNQTYQNFELIVVDNFSKDNTEEVVKSFQDKRLQYYKNANNGIIAVSRNYGIKKASGKFVAFLDSDDLWYENKLSTVIQFFGDHPDCDILSHNQNWIFREEYDRKERVLFARYYSFEDLLFKGNCFATSATVVKRKKIEEAGLFSEREEFAGSEDYELWLRLSQVCCINFLDDVLGEYIVHGSSFSQKIEHQTRVLLNAVQLHFDKIQPKTKRILHLMRRRKADILRQAARDFIKRGDKFSAKPYIKKSLQLNPFCLKAFYSLLISYF